MPKSTVSKIFVLDTNVLLHDHSCLSNFQENDIVIPLTVLDELDKFKGGNETINFNAREIGRTLDRISSRALLSEGAPLGDGLGKLTIVPGKPFLDEMIHSFPTHIPDHQILSTALWVQEQNASKRPVILVSKDSILRAKAKALGLMAEDYKSDMVKDINILDQPVTTLENIDPSISQQLRDATQGIKPEQLDIQPLPNQCYQIQDTNGISTLICYNGQRERFEAIHPLRVYGIEPRNNEQTIAIHLLTDKQIPLISLTGMAGTGKTLLALAAALHLEQDYESILLARPIVPLSNRDIGFLPGDVNAKIAPYTQPLLDNLAVIKSALRPTSREAHRIEEMQKDDKLIITPLAYIRGRSLANAFVIIDEAQNLTPHEIKTIITRAGEGTKMVFTGDIYQIDQPYLNTRSNGLSYMTEKMTGHPMFAHVNLVQGERSPLANLANELL